MSCLSIYSCFTFNPLDIPSSSLVAAYLLCYYFPCVFVDSLAPVFPGRRRRPTNGADSPGRVEPETV